MLAHPETLSADALTRVLSDAGCRFVARVGDARAVYDAVTAHDPTIVLIQDSLLSSDLALVNQLSHTPSLNIAVLICDTRLRSAAMNALMAGARGCLSCNDTPAHFLSALRFFREGATVVSFACSRVFKSPRTLPQRRTDSDALRVLERQVATPIGCHQSQDLATALHILPQREATLRQHSRQAETSESPSGRCPYSA